MRPTAERLQTIAITLPLTAAVPCRLPTTANRTRIPCLEHSPAMADQRKLWNRHTSVTVAQVLPSTRFPQVPPLELLTCVLPQTNGGSLGPKVRNATSGRWRTLFLQ